MRTCRTYFEAAEMLGAGHADIVVAGTLPGTADTGIDACVAAIERHPRVTSVLISADSPGDQMTKPFDPYACAVRPVSQLDGGVCMDSEN
jgi:hypothetical protein